MSRPPKQSRELRAIANKVLRDTTNLDVIVQAMALLGSRTSKAKTRAARSNGKRGGRPRKDPTQ